MNIFKKIGSLFSVNSSNSTLITPVEVDKVKVNDSMLKAQKVELNRVINNADLSPEEILMLALNEEKDTSNDFFPGYWQYNYDVNPQILFSGLVERGFYSKEKSLLITLARKTAEDLKCILRDNGLKVSGRKQELIDRIIEELNEGQLNSIELIEVYKINEKAKAILDKNEHILFFHNSSMEISIYTAQDFKTKNPDFTPIEIARFIGEKQANQHIDNGNWGLFRNVQSSLAQTEMDAQNFEEALVLLFEVCYLDLSGMGNNFDPEYMDIIEEYFFPYKDSVHTLAPGIVHLFKKLKVKLNITDSDIKDLFLKSLENYQLSFHLFTKEEAANILIAELNYEEVELKQIYKVAENRYFLK